MEGAGNVKILFIAGFGPIVRDAGESRKLYGEVLCIPFKEESDGYLHTETLQGGIVLPCGRFLRRRSPASAKTRGPMTFQYHKHGSSLKLTASKRQRRILNRVGIACLSRIRKNHGARPSAGSSHQRDCWSALLSLHSCAKRNSRERRQESDCRPNARCRVLYIAS